MAALRRLVSSAGLRRRAAHGLAATGFSVPVNANGAMAGDGKTQFGRAMDDLDIDVIFANTQVAKGLDERRRAERS